MKNRVGLLFLMFYIMGSYASDFANNEESVSSSDVLVFSSTINTLSLRMENFLEVSGRTETFLEIAAAESKNVEEISNWANGIFYKNLDSIVEGKDENPTRMVGIPCQKKSDDQIVLDQANNPFVDRMCALERGAIYGFSHTPIMTLDRVVSLASTSHLTVVQCGLNHVLGKAINLSEKKNQLIKYDNIVYALPTLRQKEIRGGKYGLEIIEDIVYMVPVNKNGSIIRFKPSPKGVIPSLAIYNQSTGEVVFSQECLKNVNSEDISKNALCKGCLGMFRVAAAKNF